MCERNAEAGGWALPTALTTFVDEGRQTQSLNDGRQGDRRAFGVSVPLSAIAGTLPPHESSVGRTEGGVLLSQDWN